MTGKDTLYVDHYLCCSGLSESSDLYVTREVIDHEKVDTLLPLEQVSCYFLPWQGGQWRWAEGLGSLMLDIETLLTLMNEVLQLFG